MFHLEVTGDEKSILETAVNHEVGALLANVARLTFAHGAGSAVVETAQRKALIAQNLSDKLLAAPFKLAEATRS